MTLDERIIDFLDGSLPSDDEAELLHTLSVSPEKRVVLRGLIDQRTLLARDAESLSVPAKVEEGLWERINKVLPLDIAGEMSAPQVALLPVVSRSAGFFAHAFNGISSAISALTLVAGLGIGYVAGHSESRTVPAQKVHAAVPDQTNVTSAIGMIPDSHLKQLPAIPLPHSLYDAPLPIASVTPIPEGPAISSVAPIAVPAIAVNDIGGDGKGNIPIFHKGTRNVETDPSFISRFEFRIDESFGKQTPNSMENAALPIITNSSITTFFQILPHSNLFWVGAAFGSANVTKKELSAQIGDPTDPLQQAVVADTAHFPTSYLAALAELRLPAFETADITFTGGYGLATLGQMMFGEIGLHYNMSSSAGIQCGLRVLRFSYDLNAEKQSVINSGTSSLAISNAAAASAPSFNTEFNAGLFFHF
ncbi:MAG TPA: hypothetical protein VGM92_14575 [Candidatus Kapabacteria bacterium]|jgi:hypothetical protein